MTSVFDFDAIRATVVGRSPSTLSKDGLVEASVLLLLMGDGAGGASVVLTRRSAQLSSHAGQVSFPGGRADPTDSDAEETALRECHEELGIPRHAVEVVGRLDEMRTGTGFHLTPVVGWCPEAVPLRPDPREVARAFTVPLADVLDRERWHQRDHAHAGQIFRLWHLPYDGEQVWGVTGIILRAFAESLWQRG